MRSTSRSPDRGRPTVTGVGSYRGYYEDLAIGYEMGGEKPKLDDFCRTLREAVGETFEGYKGGSYRMSRDTVVWVSNYGECESLRITGVEVDDDTAYLTMTVAWDKR